jgi:hypothetical protein
MKKDTIVQFVGFVTTLNLEAFAPLWERYAKRLMTKKNDTSLQQLGPETKNKFRFISQHEWPDKDLQFSFMNEKKSEHFPEGNVKVVQTGGYIALQVESAHGEEEGANKLVAFISHNENDIDFYRDLTLYSHLNIYQAYYESCSHGYVMEFFVPEADTAELVKQLKQRPGIEMGVYHESLVPHA